MFRALLYGLAFALAISAARAADATAPHVALLLPLSSPSFARHADAVRLGFLAAAKIQSADSLPVRVYAAGEDTQNLLTVYQQAVEAGAQLIVGPLTRSGVAALAASSVVSVPTLALNAFEGQGPQPPRLYLFGLSIELEARQAARHAFEEGRRNAFVISDDTPLSKRMRHAFGEEFAAAGGTVVAEFAYRADAPSLNKLRQAVALGVADVFFVALNFVPARTVRPYVGNSIAVYATSQVNAYRANPLAAHDLNLVRFLDMPWLLQPDHQAVMVYPRAQYGDALDFERLYALGIDAFRIGVELLRLNPEPVIDGVTGRIRLAPGRQFVRDLTEAQFVDGKIIVLREPTP